MTALPALNAAILWLFGMTMLAICFAGQVIMLLVCGALLFGRAAWLWLRPVRASGASR